MNKTFNFIDKILKMMLTISTVVALINDEFNWAIIFLLLIILNDMERK